MQRYLIYHDVKRGTWDLVIVGDKWTVEHINGSQRRSFTLAEFEQTADGVHLARELAQARARVVNR